MSPKPKLTPLKIRPVEPPKLEVYEAWSVSPVSLYNLRLDEHGFGDVSQTKAISIPRGLFLEDIIEKLPESALGFRIQTNVFGYVSGDKLSLVEFHATEAQNISPTYLLNRYGLIRRAQSLPPTVRLLNLREGDQPTIRGYLRLTEDGHVVYTVYQDQLEGDFPELILVDLFVAEAEDQ